MAKLAGTVAEGDGGAVSECGCAVAIGEGAQIDESIGIPICQIRADFGDEVDAIRGIVAAKANS